MPSLPGESQHGRGAYRRCTRQYLACFFGLILAIVLLNYWIDPLWMFPHGHRFNVRQVKIDERQQKTNLLTYVQHDFDALLLGSSRCSFISYRDFQGIKLFNYAMDNTLPEEYADYIAYARKQSKPGIKLIVIGLDFFGTNSNFLGYGQQQPEEYFRNAQNPLYRLKSLFVFDTFRYSLKNIYKSLKKPDGFYYTRDTVKAYIRAPRSPEAQQKDVQYTLREFRKRMYGENYKYKNMKAIFRKIKETNPDVRIVVFTTPTTQPLWELLVEQGRLDDYCRWIGDIVAEFGEVTNFMGVNTITANLDNFYDGHHFFPPIGRLIAARVMNMPDSRLPEDFGQRVNRENLDKFLADIHRKYDRPAKSPDGKGRH